MKIIVTGGAGFLGRHICAELVRCEHSVRAFDLSQSQDRNVWPGSILDYPSLARAMIGMDAVMKRERVSKRNPDQHVRTAWRLLDVFIRGRFLDALAEKAKVS